MQLSGFVETAMTQLYSYTFLVFDNSIKFDIKYRLYILKQKAAH